MTPNEQLEKWLNGESVHNKERDECCPDFSCCKPNLLADRETRQLFYNAHKAGREDIKDRLLVDFLGKMLAENSIDAYISFGLTGDN